jgi:hypothetical protein
MSVVVFVVGSRASKLDRVISLCEMFEEVIIEELAAVVTIKAEQGER